MRWAVALAGSVLWRLEYRHMGSPGAICLISGVNDPGAVFALSGKVGRSPRVFAARDRDGLLRQLQAAALKRMGITIAGRLNLPCFPGVVNHKRAHKCAATRMDAS